MKESQVKLLDGFYKVNGTFTKSWKIDGNKIDVKDAHDSFDFKPRFEYGDFGKKSWCTTFKD